MRVTAIGGIGPLPGGELSDRVLAVPRAIGPRSGRIFFGGEAMHGRGRRRLAPAVLAVRDPLGLHERRLESADPGECLVLPRIEPVLAAGRGADAGRGSVLAGVEDGNGQSPLDLRAIELEVDGLRRYREGTPASRIHWPSVARNGELIERRLISDSVPLIVLDAWRPDSDEALDRAVRAAGSLAFQIAAAGGCGLLLPAERRPAELDSGLANWPSVHARLALVEASASAPTPTRALRSGAVFWVAARAAAKLPKLLEAGSAPRYLVVPAAGPAARVRGPLAFTVSGCDGIKLRARAHVRRAA